MSDKNYSVAAKIKEIRLHKNITQLAVAKVLGLTVTAYNRIENNKTQLTINNLFIIAEVLQVGVDELLELNKVNILNNHNNFVVSQFNNGTLHMSISAKDLEKIVNKSGS